MLKDLFTKVYSPYSCILRKKTEKLEEMLFLANFDYWCIC